MKLIKLFKNLLCRIFGHKIILVKDEKKFQIDNKTVCLRCNHILDINVDKYNVRCNISNRLVWANLIKLNNKTIYVKYKNDIIKRHFKKHNVILKEAE